MAHRFNRRNFLKATTGALLLPALGMESRRALASGTCSEVVVGTWGGDYENLLDQNIGPIVAKSEKVVFATADQVTRMTKMRAEKMLHAGSLDVTCLADTDMYDMYTSGLLLPLDKPALSNLPNVLEQFQHDYAIPHIFSAFGLVYNTEKLPKPPGSMKDLLDPRYKGKVGLSDILYAYVGMMAALADGDRSAAIKSGIKFLREFKNNSPKVFPSNETVAAALKNGEVWMTLMWKARAVQWKKNGLPVEFFVQQEGAVPVIFEAAVPKNSPRNRCAFAYLNAMLDPRAQVGFAKTMGYAPTVKNAALPPELQAAVGFTEAELGKFIKPDYKTFRVQRPEFLNYWNTDFKNGL